MARAWRIEFEGTYCHVLSRENEGRDILVYLLWERGAFTNEEIGRFFGVSYSDVSHIVGGQRPG